jgi:transcriptional regulator with XRE-family HTH domain
MPTKRKTGLVQQLRDAIEGCGLSLNRLGKSSGVATPQLSRFMRGERTLTLPAAEKLCEALGLELTKRQDARGGRRGADVPGGNRRGP